MIKIPEPKTIVVFGPLGLCKDLVSNWKNRLWMDALGSPGTAYIGT